MADRTAVLIYNPKSGRGGARRERDVARFCKLLKAGGVRVEALRTEGPDDAARLARIAASEGVRDIIASGGDGTINEVLQGMIGTGARLGVWPAGTANVLARELSIPFKLERAAEVIMRGDSRRIHVGRATVEATDERRYFFLMAGIGLDASVVQKVRPRLKRRFGKAAFWYSGFGHLAHWEPTPFQVEIEGETFSATFAAVGKGPRYGGGLPITPRARLDQPEFELCLIDSRSRLRYLYLLSHVVRGNTGLDVADVKFIRATRARATGDAPVQVDGELIGRLPMTFDIAPHSVEVITK
ncbi:MAG TPA: diacylglycerol kinase family protein [Pyrinomonadaceae bacterium]|jgi:YegS/Rv2252/BmrU family lipid kinase